MKTSVSWVDGAYLATCDQFPRLSAHGATEQEALAELAIAVNSAIEFYTENGWPLPEGETMSEDETDQETTLDDLEPDYKIAWHLQSALELMQAYKPDVKPELGRQWAIGITELEKTIAWWDYHICRAGFEPVEASER